MSKPAPSPNESTADREIVITRLINAPRELVYRAFVDPVRIVRWWGPNGFKNTTSTMDVRPGGYWRYVMHGPDGVDYPNVIKYVEVVPNERLAYEHMGDVPEGEVSFRAVITFEERDGKTLVTLYSIFPTAAARDFVVENYGAIEGGEQNLGRLAAYVSLLPGSFATAEEIFVLSRELDAPRELVYRAWTESDRLARWWGPKGMGMETVALDLRPDGEFRYAMKAPNGNVLHGKFVYWEVVPPERFTYLVSFTDSEWRPMRHPLSATWPLEVLSVVELEEIGKRTRLTLKAVPFNASEEEIRTFVGAIGGMTQGWAGTFQNLTAYLAEEVGGPSVPDEFYGMRAATEEKALVFTRRFEASTDLMFRMFTEPRHLMKWWGPHHFTSPRCETDPRPGGRFLLVMAGPDGTEFPLSGTYDEVVPGRKLVYRGEHGTLPAEWHEMINQFRGAPVGSRVEDPVVTIKFDPAGSGTELTIVTTFASNADRDAFAMIQMAQGWAQSLDKLEKAIPTAESA